MDVVRWNVFVTHIKVIAQQIWLKVRAVGRTSIQNDEFRWIFDMRHTHFVIVYQEMTRHIWISFFFGNNQTTIGNFRSAILCWMNFRGCARMHNAHIFFLLSHKKSIDTFLLHEATDDGFSQVRHTKKRNFQITMTTFFYQIILRFVFAFELSNWIQKKNTNTQQNGDSFFLFLFFYFCWVDVTTGETDKYKHAQRMTEMDEKTKKNTAKKRRKKVVLFH